MNKSRLFSVLMSVALLPGCGSVGVGFGIPIGPFSIGVGAGSGGVSLGVGTGVGAGVGAGTVLYDPNSQPVQPAAPKKSVEAPASPRSPTLLN